MESGVPRGLAAASSASTIVGMRCRSGVRKRVGALQTGMLLHDGWRRSSGPRSSNAADGGSQSGVEPKLPTRRAGRILVAPGASPGSVPPTIARARPARRVECYPDLDENDRVPWTAGLRALGPLMPPYAPESYSTRFAGRPGSRRGGIIPGFHPGLPMFDPRPAGRRRAAMTNEK
mgnify:CR=1 FL=1